MFLKRLFCKHDWALLRCGSIFYYGEIEGSYATKICMKCGKEKTKKWNSEYSGTSVIIWCKANKVDYETRFK